MPSRIILERDEDAICGYQDHLALLKAFTHATCSILDQAGHMLEIEQPALYRACLPTGWSV
ncbi:MULTISPECIES: hypothetical protein [Brevibacillus]|uniref:Alpha/beta hydrolase n=1 Tax=Brevibacillus invocatus TaxID=173959 RepID=A0A3M8C9E1_9BACL|nr:MULTISPECIES: hypothetical protein [Brevibacillus]RNB72219.1 hypothetical protein EDM52_13760 [Brevibacillus invocatus]